MHTYVAFLRGINVGGNARIAMGELRDLLNGLGLRDVRTHLQSGNAVFTSECTDTARLGEQIAAQIEHELGLAVGCLVRGRDELKQVVDGNPLLATATDHAKLQAVFLGTVPDPALVSGIDPAAFTPDEFAFTGREIYVWTPAGVSKTRLTLSFWEKRLKVTATARNWKTVVRMLELADGET